MSDSELPRLTTEIPGPEARAYVARDKDVVSPSLSRSYPFVMERGEGSLVWDVDGNRYVDFSAGIAVAATGHAHPKVVKAIQDQAARFVHMSGAVFYYAAQIELAEKLSSLVPGNEPKQVLFANSGAEVVESAWKLVRYHTGRPRAIAFLGAFHGRTMGALSLTGSKVVQQRGFEPLVPGVTHVPYGYCFRCAYNLEYPSCDLHCVDYIEKTLFKHLVPGDEVGAIFVEPIQGEGGYVVPPPGYHQRLKDLAERWGILFVADEIQMGFGRTGKWFSIEHWGVAPDITVLAKGIASGMPLGAMVARKELMDWPPGAHGSTFGGNPVSCAAASATVQVIEEEGLLENAEKLGSRLIEALRQIQSGHPSVGDVRGKGLAVGVELIDPDTREPASQLRDEVVQAAFGRGLLLLGCGSSTLRFMPALTIDTETLDQGVGLFEEVLAAAEQRA